MEGIELGWSLHKREEHLLQLKLDPTSKIYDTKINFMDQDMILPVWKIPIGLPKYRLLNGRTSSLQLEWLSKHPKKPKDFFYSDPEREEVQEIQHELLKELTSEKDLLPFFENVNNKQDGFLILDDLGFVINGNRRLCTWRELLFKDSKAYSHFNYIAVIVLPRSDSKAIDKLEGKLQVDRDIRADYTWHAVANMMLDRKRLHGLDDKALAEFYEFSEQEVKKYFEMRSLADEYLKTRNIEGQWSEVDKKEYAFEQLALKRAKLDTVGEKRLFEIQSFALIDDPTGGRSYESISDLVRYKSEIKKNLLEAFPVVLPKEEKEDRDLLGTSEHNKINLILADVINDKENRVKALEIIKDTIETQESLKKGENTARYVLKQLQKANALIQSAFAGTTNKKSLKEGVNESITSIEHSLAQIKEWLNS